MKQHKLQHIKDAVRQACVEVPSYIMNKLMNNVDR